MQRAAAVSTGPYTHLDHLGVLASLLSIPLIVIDERSYALAKTFYPQSEVVFKQPGELTLDFLAENFDLLLGCGKYWCLELQPLFELLYRKKMRFALCPHGNSDKGSTAETHPQQDIAFIYGEQMEKMMRDNGMMEKVTAVVRTGNYRYPFYLKHHAFYDALAERQIFYKLSKQKKTILYAPTWSSKTTPLQFFHTCESLIQTLSSEYNLLIKPHPFTEEDVVGELSLLHAKHEHNSNVAFADGFPAIYPLLARCDAYLGDYSSIGYDFLAFDRPLYFFQTSHQNPTLIAQAGVELGED
ncbi:MAG: CDP-glycerol glycerophosphotransferase family protein, partial [Chlamydiales bacterium]